MNKTTLYTLSIVTMLLIVVSVIIPGVEMVKYFSAGFSAGMNAYDERDEVHQSAKAPNTLSADTDGTHTDYIPLTVQFKPEIRQITNSRDTIIFEDGTPHTVVVTEALVFVPDNKIPGTPYVISTISSLASIVLLIILMCKFFKFILNISKERIFIQANAKYLRHFAYCLIGIAILQIVSGLIDDNAVRSLHLQLSGYQLSAAWVFPWSDLLIGIVSLLISFIWSRAVAIKNENELTI